LLYSIEKKLKKKMAEHDIVRVTDNLANSLNILYKAGVLASIFCFSGILMILAANLLGGKLWLLTLGIVLTGSALGLLLLTIIKVHAEATKTLEESKETIDAIQEISLQLIRLSKRIHTYSFKNIGRINEIIQLVSSFIESIPIFGVQAKKYGLSEASVISDSLVENADKLDEFIENIEEALIKGDNEKILEYSNALSEWF